MACASASLAFLITNGVSLNENLNIGRSPLCCLRCECFLRNRKWPFASGKCLPSFLFLWICDSERAEPSGLFVAPIANADRSASLARQKGKCMRSNHIRIDTAGNANCPGSELSTICKVCRFAKSSANPHHVLAHFRLTTIDANERHIANCTG